MESYFRTSPIRSSVRRVDRNTNIIFGAKIIQLGEVNDDRPYLIDEETLSQVLAFGQSKPNGIKARFTHPNLCHDGLGRHLGRWKSFRREGDAILADLHIALSSFNTPHGNLGEYVLDMAEEDPEALGVSIASTLTEAMRRQIKGENKTPNNLIPYRMQALHAADIVGDPAATRGGLFSIESISDRRDVPHFVSQFLSTYFANANPQVMARKVVAMLSAHYGVPIEIEIA